MQCYTIVSSEISFLNGCMISILKTISSFICSFIYSSSGRSSKVFEPSFGFRALEFPLLTSPFAEFFVQTLGFVIIIY
ncbi:hypothetical protein GLOIN_2v1586069 [Rhizophagus irregularis DAOM 181602=DAOM 197198]|uniref:Uncharacterized protein n=1 Tax=Rhizophagus irregularis (strain DAOM 181602 / DAOM 197198 / MUCL 43194) TaxID=747089 RepID=A0A2P4Q7L2_RHIID|nr:hypothetical protein GLOIN_2v1586069 [Rhizophagus irregularis DAOM 181602=DAOM 197198]POG73588.1 hypothetical protein GLOIN_2v1586069 [Rhizophagus irregularis DAOM 181602=DAOM 197198]GET52190.1 hypothetical protein GLOIN_2v1586069 [Rhizophagus irregularis DAOM 181602=DAOM 197198]|eukprot:XP_025180454.1 hypothetical protein GLOIN_2v1586069 [Rhizophagus irregularis DAOM 181602=DAOM 197198]